LVAAGQQGNHLGLPSRDLSHLSPGFAIAIFHIAGHKVREETVLVILTL
jgi:hypothetical protein